MSKPEEHLMTNIEHAAVFLRVPMSGTDWLDAMIIEARRWDAAVQCLPRNVSEVSVQCANALTCQMKESIPRNSPISPKTP